MNPPLVGILMEGGASFYRSYEWNPEVCTKKSYGVYLENGAFGFLWSDCLFCSKTNLRIYITFQKNKRTKQSFVALYSFIFPLSVISGHLYCYRWRWRNYHSTFYSWSFLLILGKEIFDLSNFHCL
jgi:hypothetical protein